MSSDKFVTARVRLPASMRESDQESVRLAVEHILFELENKSHSNSWYRPPGFKITLGNTNVVIEDAP